MKALITGGDGFVGPHLKKELSDAGYTVINTGRYDSVKIFLDVLDYEKVRAVLYLYRPDFIFHLAGAAFVPSSWQDPKLTFEVNTIGTLNVLNAVRALKLDPVIQIAGSSEEYGEVFPGELPVKETNPLRPLSPYAVSKIAADFLGFQYFKSFGIRSIRTRAFNHEGWGRPETYAPSGFAKQIVEIEKGLSKPVIYHGDLSSQRDISDVRDIARAYRLAVEKCAPGDVYNIGSGTAHSLEYILGTLLSLSNVKAKLKLDPARLRPSDVPILVSDSRKFRKLTGWVPKYSLKDTLDQELDYWREMLK